MGYLFQAFKPLLSDFLSTIFFIAVMQVTGNLLWAVAAGMILGLAQIAILKLRGRQIQMMQWAGLALVIVLGSVSIATNNPVFAMLKPSIANLAIGLVMMTPNWQVRYLPAIVTQNVSQPVLLAWGYVWALAMLALSAANAYVALELGKAAWMQFAAFVPLPAQLALFLLQYAWLRTAVRRSIRAKAAAQPA
ncbi:MAG: septation protein IspZ [Alphaproteobacteria bacterium]|nr:septation protein IspZ [Alphaproteobacteria bacterium]